MRSSKRVSSIVALSCLFVAQTALAGPILFDNGGPDQNSQRRSDFGGSLSPQFQVGDDFSLVAGGTAVSEVAWWGSYAFNIAHADVFTIRVFDFAGGTPQVSPTFEFAVGAVSRTNTGLVSSNGGFAIYEYSASIPTTTLLPGNSYLLSIVNDSGALGDWAWSTSAAPSPAYARSGVSTAVVETTAWSTVGTSHAFLLRGADVPEPTTSTLIVLAIGGILFHRRRHQRRPQDHGD